LLLSVGLVDCRTAALSGTGANVATSQSAPVDHGYPKGACRSLGFVVGRGGGSFGGSYITNENLVEYAMNDLRNQVAEKGGNFVQHDTPQLGVPGGDGATSTATVSGTAYFCEGDPSAETAAPATAATTEEAKPAGPRMTEPPEGAGGFKFAQSVEEAQAACTRGGGAWKLEGDQGSCSSTPVSVGSTASASLGFCGGKVCRIDIAASPPNAELLAKYEELYKALRKKYGIPMKDRAELPAECSSDVNACVSGGKAPQGATWKWPNAFQIDVGLSSTSNAAAAVRLTYRNPDSVAKEAPGPDL
jgi:hypothetical protein